MMFSSKGMASEGEGQGKEDQDALNQVEQLVAQAQRGNLAAFNELVGLFEQRMYNLAYRLLGEAEAAQDATQDAFLQAYKALNQYRGGSFKSWLLKIGSNICYDRLRSRKRRPSTSLDQIVEEAEEAGGAMLGLLEDPNADPQDHALRHEMMRELNRALNLLPPDQRLIVVLSDVQGMSYDEIVVVSGCSLGTVKSRLSRGRAKLREHLQQNRELFNRYERLQ